MEDCSKKSEKVIENKMTIEETKNMEMLETYKEKVDITATPLKIRFFSVFLIRKN